MKNNLFATVAVVAVIVGGTLGANAVVNHYQSYQNKKSAEVAQVTHAQQVKEATAANKLGTAETEAQTAYGQCLKAAEAYKLLTPVVQAKVPAPVCSAPSVQ